MAWRDNLQDASLNGVPFFYENVRTQGGRKVAEFDFPGRDENFIEDLGLKPKRFNVRAYVIGVDYDVDRDALVDVLDSGEDLTFQHPYQGEFTVRLVGGYTFSEDSTQGGIAIFDFVLVESGPSFPIVSQPSNLDVVTQAQSIQQTLVDTTPFDILGAIGDVFDAVRDGIFEASSLIRKQNGRINAITGAASSIDSSIDLFEDQVTDLMNQPQNLINQLVGLTSSITDLINNFVPEDDHQQEQLKKASLNTTEEVMNFEIESSATVIPTNQNEIENASTGSVEYSTQVTYVAGLCVNLTNLPITSSDEALGLLGTIDGYFNQLLNSEQTTPVLYEDLLRLRTAISNYLLILAKNTPSVQEYTPPATTVALAAAYEIFGDARREQELIDENGIIDPAFLSGQTALRYIP